MRCCELQLSSDIEKINLPNVIITDAKELERFFPKLTHLLCANLNVEKVSDVIHHDTLLKLRCLSSSVEGLSFDTPKMTHITASIRHFTPSTRICVFENVSKHMIGPITQNKVIVSIRRSMFSKDVTRILSQCPNIKCLRCLNLTCEFKDLTRLRFLTHIIANEVNVSKSSETMSLNDTVHTIVTASNFELDYFISLQYITIIGSVVPVSLSEFSHLNCQIKNINCNATAAKQVHFSMNSVISVCENNIPREVYAKIVRSLNPYLGIQTKSNSRIS